MSSRRNKGGTDSKSVPLGAWLLAIGLGLAAAGAASPAAGFELRLWPLVEVKTGASESEWHLLGPIVEWRRDRESSSFALRPLLHTTRSLTSDRSRGTFLYPVAWWDRSSDEVFFRALGLFTYRHSRAPSPGAAYTTQLTVFPLVFFRQGPTVPTSFSVLPLYADLSDFFGYQRIQLLLFPLYLKLTEPFDERTWIPFPFYSWVGGRAGSGWRLWPVYGRTVVGGESDTTYVGWPLYIRSIVHPGREEQVTSRISWPFFSAIEGPKLESRSYAYLLLLLPLYTHTIDHAADSETYGFPWPFWVYQVDRKSGERQSLRLTPFYQDRQSAAMHSVFYFWPFYRHRTGEGDDASYERTDVLFVLYRNQSEGEGATRQHIFILLPFWSSRADGETASAQAPSLFDGMFPKNEEVRRLYAPLYRLYGSETRGQETERDVLWRMWVWGDGKFRAPWYFSLD